MRTTLIAAREPWRAHSIISPALRGTLQGLGWRSYTGGLRALVELAAEAQGPESDPANPLFYQVGENVLKGRLRSHPDVAARHYAQQHRVAQEPVPA